MRLNDYTEQLLFIINNAIDKLNLELICEVDTGNNIFSPAYDPKSESPKIIVYKPKKNKGIFGAIKKYSKIPHLIIDTSPNKNLSYESAQVLNADVMDRCNKYLSSYINREMWEKYTVNVKRN